MIIYDVILRHSLPISWATLPRFQHPGANFMNCCFPLRPTAEEQLREKQKNKKAILKKHDFFRKAVNKKQLTSCYTTVETSLAAISLLSSHDVLPNAQTNPYLTVRTFLISEERCCHFTSVSIYRKIPWIVPPWHSLPLA